MEFARAHRAEAPEIADRFETRVVGLFAFLGCLPDSDRDLLFAHSGVVRKDWDEDLGVFVRVGGEERFHGPGIFDNGSARLEAA